MKAIDTVRKQVLESVSVKTALLQDEKLLAQIARAADICVDAYRRGNKVMFAGNGGSAADAQHLAGELVNKFYFNRPGLPAIALSTDTSIMTAISNDFGFNRIFARQIEAQGVPGDVFIGISTSGNSQNLVEALPACQAKGITSIALTGSRPSQMDAYDITIKAPSAETPRIQECQTLIGHIICCIIEAAIFGQNP